MPEKTIGLCGIGNGLVDIQIEVEDSFLKNYNLNKGQMQLASADEQSKLLSNLAQYTQHKSSGGSAANTIIAFSQFGGKAAYMTSLGKDDLGKFYAKEFTNLGIELSAKIDTEKPTGTCLVLISPDAERTMVTALGASSSFTKNDLNEELISKSEWLYIEGYEFTQPDSSKAVFKAVEMAKKHKTKIALTFSDVFVIEIFSESIREIALQSDLIFCNELEAIRYASAPSSHIAIELLTSIQRNFAVTFGSEGSIVKWKGEIYKIPPYPAIPKDSTGAGDMYAGGFMYGLARTSSPITAGHLGSLAASKVVSQLGARLKASPIAIRDEIFSSMM